MILQLGRPKTEVEITLLRRRQQCDTNVVRTAFGPFDIFFILFIVLEAVVDVRPKRWFYRTQERNAIKHARLQLFASSSVQHAVKKQGMNILKIRCHQCDSRCISCGCPFLRVLGMVPYNPISKTALASKSYEYS